MACAPLCAIVLRFIFVVNRLWITDLKHCKRAKLPRHENFNSPLGDCCHMTRSCNVQCWGHYLCIGGNLGVHNMHYIYGAPRVAKNALQLLRKTALRENGLHYQLSENTHCAHCCAQFVASKAPRDWSCSLRKTGRYDKAISWSKEEELYRKYISDYKNLIIAHWLILSIYVFSFRWRFYRQ